MVVQQPHLRITQFVLRGKRNLFCLVRKKTIYEKKSVLHLSV